MSPGVPIRFDSGMVNRYDPSVSKTLIYDDEEQMRQRRDPSISETSRYNEDSSIKEPGKGRNLDRYA